MSFLRIAATALVAFAGAALASAQDAVPQAPPGFSVETIAHVKRARELTIVPNGDLVVGTESSDVYLVADPEGSPRAPELLASLKEPAAAGVAYASGALYVGTQFGVWRIPYGPERGAPAQPVKIAAVRQDGSSGHHTTSVAVAGNRLYFSVGSSCNVCTETDPTRAKVFEAALDGTGAHPIAVNIRNAIALGVQPGGAVWAGVAGQDELEDGHPYEIFDPVTAHPSPADYGWPLCYENRRPVHPGDECSGAVVPRVVFPAYETPIGAVFYPLHETGRFAFPAEYAGGAFVTLHGSWHTPRVPPRVAFVPFREGEPQKAVDWNDPGVQWREFLGGFQNQDGSRNGRPTGIAVGAQGSLFVADDQAGAVYRIRPSR